MLTLPTLSNTSLTHRYDILVWIGLGYHPNKFLTILFGTMTAIESNLKIWHELRFLLHTGRVDEGLTC